MIKIIKNDGTEANVVIYEEIVINPWMIDELKEKLTELLQEYKL